MLALTKTGHEFPVVMLPSSPSPRSQVLHQLKLLACPENSADMNYACLLLIIRSVKASDLH